MKALWDSKKYQKVLSTADEFEPMIMSLIVSALLPAERRARELYVLMTF